MSLDADTCYAALASRDRRFEGRFVVAVRTTRVYCRPGCPAPMPQRRNTTFYPCPAAAEDAGYRPCRRCRPDAAPGTPAWSGTSATVSRALRLIEEGHLDEADLERLAARLGVGGRHLRRLFAEHLGTSPATVARVRRVHFARRLLDETALPITEVALGSGFASLRTFNTAMRRTFGRPPRELRARAGAGRARSLVLRLPYRAPLDWDALLGFFAARAVAGVEEVAGDAYRRTVQVGSARGSLAVRPGPGHTLELSIDVPGGRELLAVAGRVSRVFDLGADPERITAHLSRDPVLRRVLRAHPGLRVPGAWDPFEMAVRAVVGQQVSVAGARTVLGRMAAGFGEPLGREDGPGLGRLFPTPAALARADLTRVGLTRARAATVQGLARAVEAGELDFATGGSLEATASRLQELPGVGPWTAQYIALRAGEPDAFPSGDLGLLRALGRAGVKGDGPRGLPGARQLQERAERWRPWRGYAALALWMSDREDA